MKNINNFLRLSEESIYLLTELCSGMEILSLEIEEETTENKKWEGRVKGIFWVKNPYHGNHTIEGSLEWEETHNQSTELNLYIKVKKEEIEILVQDYYLSTAFKSTINIVKFNQLLETLK